MRPEGPSRGSNSAPAGGSAAWGDHTGPEGPSRGSNSAPAGGSAAWGDHASETPVQVALSLISHTNVGKTALARTLLGRDVGEVRDEAHVTVTAERYPMIESPQGDVLVLWDTPGFGDSARLARRLAVLDKPIVGFLAMTWDRWRDRALWSSQQAVRNVRDEADIVLYLVNAAESPLDAGYIAPELTILEWIGKPVIALLNQVGRPRAASDEAADVARWRDALGPRPMIHGGLSLAFLSPTRYGSPCTRAPSRTAARALIGVGVITCASWSSPYFCAAYRIISPR